MPYEPLSNFISKNILPTENDPVIPPKDFDTWNIKKKSIECTEKNILCKPGSVWWCSLGLNIGREVDGKHENFERPVLIVKTLSKDTYLCVPLTSSDKEHRLRIPLKSFSEKSKAIISQIKTISSKRLLCEIAIVSREDLSVVKKSLRKLLK